MPRVTIKYKPKATLKVVSKSLDIPLNKAALMVEREAKLLLSTGGGKARTPSQAPAPPHLQTGNLRASIAWEPARLRRRKSRLIGPKNTAFYGKIHEFGLAGFDARPFMGPALRNVLPRITPLFKNLKFKGPR